VSAPPLTGLVNDSCCWKTHPGPVNVEGKTTMTKRLCSSLIICTVLLLASCGTPAVEYPGASETASVQPTPAGASPQPGTPPSNPAAVIPDTPPSPAGEEHIQVMVDVNQDVHPISPLIYGVSNAPTNELQAMGAALNSWGG